MKFDFFPHSLAQWLGAIFYAVIEYWLGKTQKTQIGSILEALIWVLKYLFRKVWRKKNERVTQSNSQRNL